MTTKKHIEINVFFRLDQTTDFIVYKIAQLRYEYLRFCKIWIIWI